MGTASEYERRKNLVRSIVDDMFNAGNLQVAAEIFAPNFVDRGHETEAGKTDGPAGFAGFVSAVRSALRDIEAVFHNMVDDGDHVAMWNTATATHRGVLFGMPPTGRKIRMKDFHFFRFQNGKIVEHWNSVTIAPDDE